MKAHIQQGAAVNLRNYCNADSSNVPELATVDSYDSMELNAEFLNLGIEKLQNKSADIGPPSKRRKVERTYDSFDEVTSDLYSILGAQKAVEISGLSQIAEHVYSPFPKVVRLTF
jgi:hypothetical protein